MVSRKVTIINESGLQLKPAACFCREASNYKSVITFTLDNVTANAKSVLSVLGACVKKGTEIEIVCQGEDEEEALDALCEAVKNGLEDDK